MKPAPKFKTLKERIEFYFEDVDTFPGRLTDIILISFILIVSAIYVVLTYSVPDQFRRFLFGIETAIMLFFVIEYLLRLYVAEEKLKHTLNIYSLIDLMAILPFILGFVEIGFLRIFRVFRLLRLIRFMKRKYLFGRLTNEEEYIGANLLFTIFAIIFVSSGLMYQIESPINPNINTFFDSTYYMVISLTTVGFGDITPVSTAGRAITLLAIAAGIIFVPIQISTFFKKIIEKVGKVRRTCKGCGMHYHELDATHCKGCGHRIFNKKRDG